MNNKLNQLKNNIKFKKYKLITLKFIICQKHLKFIFVKLFIGIRKHFNFVCNFTEIKTNLEHT